MSNRFFILLVSAIVTGFVLLFLFLLKQGALPVLNSAGSVGINERNLMFQASLLMLIILTAVYALLFYFAWQYRAENTRATYSPNWEHARMDELIWWAIPFEIVLVLGALTWTSTHALDPKKPLLSATPTLEIEVIALPEAWLFLYPDAGVASVQSLRLPRNTPIHFSITADAPMNSFWIPALGGQIYAMAGMETHLNLLALKSGTFEGRSANYSGEGFAQMKFPVQVLEHDAFTKWLTETKRASTTLNMATYRLLRQSQETSREFGKVEGNLFDSIITSFDHHH